MVRPWKLFFSVTMVAAPCRICPPPYLRAALMAHSLASAPELPKKTFFMPVFSQSVRGKLGAGLGDSRGWRCAGACQAARSRPRPRSSSATPKMLTAMPLPRSMYSLPASSQTSEPLPSVRTNGKRCVGVGNIGFASSSLCSCSFSPTHNMVPHALVGQHLDQDGVRDAAVDDKHLLARPRAAPRCSISTLGIMPPLMMPSAEELHGSR